MQIRAAEEVDAEAETIADTDDGVADMGTGVEADKEVEADVGEKAEADKQEGADAEADEPLRVQSLLSGECAMDAADRSKTPHPATLNA